MINKLKTTEVRRYQFADEKEMTNYLLVADYL